MSGYALDTDVCVWALRKRESVLHRLRSLSPPSVFVTTMTLAELHYGALKSRDPEVNLARVQMLTGPLGFLDFDAEAARGHAEVRWALRATPIGERDLVLASVVRVNGLILATGNTREFANVPGLVVEDWVA